MVGSDMDGVWAAGFRPDGEYILITGRSLNEWGLSMWQTQGKIPVYTRPETIWQGTPDEVGRHCGEWKATIINFAKLTDFYEDEPIQAARIKELCPNCKVHKVINGKYIGLW